MSVFPLREKYFRKHSPQDREISKKNTYFEKKILTVISIDKAPGTRRTGTRRTSTGDAAKSFLNSSDLECKSAIIGIENVGFLGEE